MKPLLKNIIIMFKTIYIHNTKPKKQIIFWKCNNVNSIVDFRCVKKETSDTNMEILILTKAHPLLGGKLVTIFRDVWWPSEDSTLSNSREPGFESMQPVATHRSGTNK